MLTLASLLSVVGGNSVGNSARQAPLLRLEAERAHCPECVKTLVNVENSGSGDVMVNVSTHIRFTVFAAREGLYNASLLLGQHQFPSENASVSVDVTVNGRTAQSVAQGNSNDDSAASLSTIVLLRRGVNTVGFGFGANGDGSADQNTEVLVDALVLEQSVSSTESTPFSDSSLLSARGDMDVVEYEAEDTFVATCSG